MAPPTGLQERSAEVAVMLEAVRPVGSLQPPVVAVVNWALLKLLLPDEQLDRTLQSYEVEAANPLRLADVDVVPDTTLIQVEELVALYSTS